MIDLGLSFVTGAVVGLALLDAGYFYQGRHRGEYTELPRWKHNSGLPIEGDHLFWNGPITINNAFSDSGSPVVLRLAAPGSMGTIPALIGASAGEPAPLYTRVWKDGEFVGYNYA